jgi:hypothetical protein
MKGFTIIYVIVHSCQEEEESRQGISDGVVPAFDVLDLKVEGLQVDAPPDNHGDFRCLHPQ